jgi:hypothetical protein
LKNESPFVCYVKPRHSPDFPRKRGLNFMGQFLVDVSSPEDKITTLCINVRKELSSDTGSYTSRMETPATPLRSCIHYLPNMEFWHISIFRLSAVVLYTQAHLLVFSRSPNSRKYFWHLPHKWNDSTYLSPRTLSKTTLSWRYLLLDQPFLCSYRINSSEFVYYLFSISSRYLLMQKSKHFIFKLLKPTGNFTYHKVWH